MRAHRQGKLSMMCFQEETSTGVKHVCASEPRREQELAELAISESGMET